MRNLSSLLASTSLAATCALSPTSSVCPRRRMIVTNRGDTRGGISGRDIAKCTTTLMNQSREGSSSSGEKITIETVADSLKGGHYKKILIVAGAGVSVSAGIPDVSAHNNTMLNIYFEHVHNIYHSWNITVR